MRRGTTLIEVLVVIGIIAVLIGITAPALRSTIDASRATVCLSTIRSVGQATIMYTTDHKQWPYFADKRQVEDAYVNPLYPYPRNYWMQRADWMLALHGYFAGEEYLNPAAYDPWNPAIGYTKDEELMSILPEGSVYPNDYLLSSALFTGAALWSPTNPIADESQLTPVQASAVAHPSHKVMYVETKPWHLTSTNSFHVGAFTQTKLPVVFVDGSARLIPWREMPDEVPNPLGTLGGRLVNTINGYLGRDF